MSLARTLLEHPRRLALRRALFQIHLWLGVLFALYLVVISLTGSILVYRQELTRWTLPATLSPYTAQTTLSVPQLMQSLRAAHPGLTVSNLQTPSSALPAYLLQGKTAAGPPARWWADPATGTLHPAPRTALDTVLDLHDYLLLPHTYGMQVNALGAAALLLLTFTGVVLWWPGLRVWTRGLRVNLRASWRRINYDLHSAIGFWTLALVFWWAFSGVYFGFYRQVTAAVAAISPLYGMRAPTVPAASLHLATTTPRTDLAPTGAHPAGPHPAPAKTATPTPPATLADILIAGQAASPHGRLFSVSDPSLTAPECYLLFDLRAPGDFSHRDIVRIRTADAHLLSVWHYGQRHSLGDWILWSMHPLHFGTTFGAAVKVLWSLFGLSLATLTITGLLMYWNRYLRRRWQTLKL